MEVSGFCRIFANGYKTVVDHSAGRTSDAQLHQPGIFFYAIRVTTRILQRLPFRKIELPSGESLSYNQRDVQPFLCTPCRGGTSVGYKTVQYATDNSERAGSALSAFHF